MPEISTTTDEQIRRLTKTVNELQAQLTQLPSHRMTPDEQADREINLYYGGWAAAAGFLPPVVDVAGVMAVQLRLIKRLANVYDRAKDYDDKSGRALLTALAGASAPALVGYLGGPTLVKWVPVIGPALGMIMMPGFNYGSTRFVGHYVKNLWKEGRSLADSVDTQKVREAALAARATA
jgi:uncharacterized protein (DUF697 family)